MIKYFLMWLGTCNIRRHRKLPRREAARRNGSSILLVVVRAWLKRPRLFFAQITGLARQLLLVSIGILR